MEGQWSGLVWGFGGFGKVSLEGLVLGNDSGIYYRKVGPGSGRVNLELVSTIKRSFWWKSPCRFRWIP